MNVLPLFNPPPAANNLNVLAWGTSAIVLAELDVTDRPQAGVKRL